MPKDSKEIAADIVVAVINSGKFSSDLSDLKEIADFYDLIHERVSSLKNWEKLSKD